MNTTEVTAVPCRYGTVRFLAGDEPIGLSLSQYGEWAQLELDVLLAFLGEGGTALDIGANIGTHTLAFARRVGTDGSVVAFEPQQAIFELLETNVRATSPTNTTVHHRAVGRKIGRLVVPVAERAGAFNCGMVTLADPGTQTNGDEIEVVTIDGLGFTACDLVKIDVEGMEADVLKGMSQTIRTLRPVVMVECDTIEGGVASMLANDWSRYATFFVRTSAYNPENYRGQSENIFGFAQERSLLFVPEERLPDVPSSSRDKAIIPVADFDTLAVALLETPRSGDKTPFERVSLHRLAKLGRLELDAWLPAGDKLQDLRPRMLAMEHVLAAAQAELDRTRAELDHTRAELAALSTSVAWRLTAPVRIAVDRLRGDRASRRARAQEPTYEEALATEFDYSTPEAQAALAGVSELILEIRNELAGRRHFVSRLRQLLDRALIAAPPSVRVVAIRLSRRLRHLSGAG